MYEGTESRYEHPFKKWLKNTGLKVYKAAEILDINANYLSQVLTFVRKPSDDLSVRIEAFTEGEVSASEVIASYSEGFYKYQRKRKNVGRTTEPSVEAA